VDTLVNFRYPETESSQTDDSDQKQKTDDVVSKINPFFDRGILISEPFRISIRDYGRLIMYQTLSVIPKSKKRHKQYKEFMSESEEKLYTRTLVLKSFDESLSTYKKMMKNIEKKQSDLFAPENLLSPRSRRALRILMCFQFQNKKNIFL
jgi:hypothetical protein